MPSERVQRQIDRLLDQAEEAIGRQDWTSALASAQAALALDDANGDARSYVAAAERALAVVSGSATSPPQPSPGAPSPGSDPAEVATQPRSFCEGRYEVKRFLGEGGKKRVYLAHDTKLDRDVAFALIKTDGLDEEGLLRIKREAQAMGRLGDHPHIVSVYDIGETGVGDWGLGVGSTRAQSVTPSTQSPTPYLVTQLMHGGDLDGLLQKAPGHRLPLDMTLGIADQVCQALEYAHGKGIIHRDLKPGNVWLTGDPDLQSPALNPQPPPVAKLGDFGLAMALDRTRLTQTGMMVGTVSYLPPEQATGGEITARSDLYSLGAMLYELVCGRPPFVGDESVAIIGQHLNTPPVSPTWHRPDCPPGLEALILRLLEKDPSKRPTSASDVSGMLASLRARPHPHPLPEGEGVDASPPGRGRPEGPGEGVSLAPQSPTPSPQNPVYRQTFVGREHELQQLHAAFDAAASGQGALVMLVGEPGIGKTALSEQLATYAAVRGGKTLVGHCYEEGSLSLPYLAFVEALRSYVLAREPDALSKELGSGAAEVARIISEVRDRIPVELRPAGEPEDDRWRLFQAVTGFLRNASTMQPILLVLEDLHWADRGTLDYLVHLSRNLAGARLLVVGTYRDVEVDRGHPLSGTLADLRRSANFQRIPLRGLTVDEVHRMMNLIRGQDVPWSRAEAIHRQTEGNPLFVQEVLRYLVEEGLVVREGGRFVRTDGSDPDASIPEGLRDVIGKRLSRLSPECNRILGIASVIGRDFGLQTLQALAGLSEDEVIGALEQASRVGIVEEQGRRGDLRFRFSHAMFRQTLYEEIFAPRRIRLHQAVARALEQQYSTRLEEHAAELAEHFAQGIDAEDLAKAVHYGEVAATRAMSVYAYGEAVRLLEQAIQAQEVLDPDDKGKRCDLLLALGEALGPAGEPQRVYQEVAPAALQLAIALSDDTRAARVCLIAIDEGIGRFRMSLISTSEGREWVAGADRYAPTGTPERLAADLQLLRARRLDGQLREAHDGLLRAIQSARDLGNSQIWFRLAVQAVLQDWLPEHQRHRLECALEIAGWPREGRTPGRLQSALAYTARTFLCWGDRPRAEEAWQELAALADRTRDPLAILQMLGLQVARATLDGQLEEGARLTQQLVTRSEELGSPLLGSNGEVRAVRLRLYLGRAAEALAVGERDREGSILSERGVEKAYRAVCLAHLGRTAEVSEILRSGLRDESFGIGDEIRMDVLALLLEAAVVAEDREALPTLMALMAPLEPKAFVEAHYLTCVPRHLGAAAALLGDRDGARAYCAQALEVCEKLRFRPEIALTRLAMAELLLDEARAPTLTPPPTSREALDDGGSSPPPTLGEGPGMTAEALAHLDFAIDEFRAMRMQPSLERALRHKGLLRA